MDFDNIPIAAIEEVEIVAGFPIEELFDDANKSPYRKRAMAYLMALSKGVKVTWDEMGKKSVSELWAYMDTKVESDPKDSSGNDN